MKLTIVIPAFNEEKAIGAIIERTLAARQHIVERSAVTQVDVTVVSDGSTDNTAPIARQYQDINLIVFRENRGYGAAIKRGFSESSADLVGFLDADGTCDPLFFADLCSCLEDTGAAIALGSRMGPDSQMPRIRRLGNRIYAGILSVLTNGVVHDIASGMRVIRRDALQRLYPLPDGLHFTPAMSTRALLDEHLPVVELPMAYKERVGESKLRVIGDGIRFLQTICDMTLFWRPARVFLSAAACCLIVTLLLAAHPVETWLTQGALEESTIYRLLFCSFLGSLGMICLSAFLVTESLHAFDQQSTRKPTLAYRSIDALFGRRGLIAAAAAVIPVVALLIGPGLLTRVTDGHVYVHWSRVVLAGLLAFGLCQMVVTRVVLHALGLHVVRKRFVDRLANLHQIQNRTDNAAAIPAPFVQSDVTSPSNPPTRVMQPH